MIEHVALIYVLIAAVASTLATFRRWDDLPVPLCEVAKTATPFVVIARSSPS